MGNRRIETTMGFGAARANAKVQCTFCKHGQVLTPAGMMALFPMPLPLDMAEKRLRCSACGAKKARITPLPAPGR